MQRMLILGAGLALLGGCSDILPTELGVERAAGPQLAVASAHREDALVGIDDAIERIAADLSETGRDRVIARTLTALREAMVALDDRRMAAALQQANAAVDSHGNAVGDGAELDQIRLAVDYAAAAHGLR